MQPSPDQSPPSGSGPSAWPVTSRFRTVRRLRRWYRRTPASQMVATAAAVVMVVAVVVVVVLVLALD